MDADTILADLRAALEGELGQGYSTISSFIERQGRLLAEQAAWETGQAGAVVGAGKSLELWLSREIVTA